MIKRREEVVRNRIYELIETVGYKLLIERFPGFIYSTVESVFLQQRKKTATDEFFKTLSPYLVGSIISSSFMRFGICCLDKMKKYEDFNENQVVDLVKEYSDGVICHYSWITKSLWYRLFLGIDESGKYLLLYFVKPNSKAQCVKKIPLILVFPGLFENDPPENNQEKKQENKQEDRDRQKNKEEDKQEDRDRQENEQEDRKEKNQEQPSFTIQAAENKEDKKEDNQENRTESPKEQPSFMKRIIIIGFFLFCAWGFGWFIYNR